MAKRKRRLVIMVKEPRPGRVKTRLGRDIGMVQASWWFRHQVADLIRRLDDPRWELVLAIAPDTSALDTKIWPGHVFKMPQGLGGLGERMLRIFQTRFSGPVVIVGSDIPDIRKDHVWRAFRTLGANDAVFGPAADGGYWLVGMKRTRRVSKHLFTNVRWSTKYALKDTLDTMPDLKIGYVERLRDVDSAADL